MEFIIILGSGYLYILQPFLNNPPPSLSACVYLLILFVLTHVMAYLYTWHNFIPLISLSRLPTPCFPGPLPC